MCLHGVPIWKQLSASQEDAWYGTFQLCFMIGPTPMATILWDIHYLLSIEKAPMGSIWGFLGKNMHSLSNCHSQLTKLSLIYQKQGREVQILF